MYRKLLLSLCVVLLSAAVVGAQEKGADAAHGTRVSDANGGADGARGVDGTDGARGVDGTRGADGADGADKAAVAEGADGPDTKTLSGMSVLGNDEAPMSLFIVPWKSSELGVETNLQRTLDERDVPVDRDVFMREVEFYQVSVGGETTRKN